MAYFYTGKMSKGEPGFKKIANKKDIKEGGLLGVELEGDNLVLAMINGQVFAMDAVRSHQAGPLEEDTLEGFNLTCLNAMAIILGHICRFELLAYYLAKLFLLAVIF
jgi:Rieske [2Fe-2S] domain